MKIYGMSQSDKRKLLTLLRGKHQGSDRDKLTTYLTHLEVWGGACELMPLFKTLLGCKYNPSTIQVQSYSKIIIYVLKFVNNPF